MPVFRKVLPLLPLTLMAVAHADGAVAADTVPSVATPQAAAGAPLSKARQQSAPASPSTRTMPAHPELYALGALLSRNLEGFQLSEAEFAAVRAGFTDGFHHRPSTETAQSQVPQIQALQHTRVMAAAQHEEQVGRTYADHMLARAGARKTSSGIVYVPAVEGSGAAPSVSDQVTVHYTGKLIDGTVFDSSVQRGQPATFALTGVIPCWTEALQLMKVGGKAQVVCPSELAYGERGAGAQIKPGATLDFEIELLNIVPAASGAVAPEEPSP